MPPKWSELRVNVDIHTKAISYIDLLTVQLTSKLGHLSTNEDWLRHAVLRYERNWLPLAVEWKGGGDIEPPRDVMWVWHLHMLNPRHYEAYCVKQFQKVVPHKLRMPGAEVERIRERTSEFWLDRFPQVPFALDPAAVTSSSAAITSQELLQLIVTSAREQASFLHQISLPHFRDSLFLRHALERYKKFLYLLKTEPNFCSNAPYDVQLLARTHMLHPVEYVMDCRNILRHVYDWREPGDVGVGLSRVAHHRAEDSWLQTYNEHLYIPGTVYRGECFSNLDYFPKDLDFQEVIDSCEIAIDDISIGDLRCKEKVVYVEGRRLNATSFSFTTFFKAKGKIGSTIHSKDHSGLGKIVFETKSHRALEFHVYTMTGFGCTKVQTSLATLTYNPRDQQDSGSFFSRTRSIDIAKVSVSDPTFKFTCIMQAAERKPHALLLTRQPFQPGALPQELLHCVANEPAWNGDAHVTATSDEECSRAAHRFGIFIFTTTS